MSELTNILFGNPDNLLDSYDLNTKGYRAAEFNQVDWNNSIVMFGCSSLFGSGLQNNETISSQLENILNRPVVNMGVPASSILFSAINQLAFAESGIKPYAVINLWTGMDRLTYFEEDKVLHIGAWAELEKTSTKKTKYLFHSWSLDRSNARSYAKVFRRFAKNIWLNKLHLEYSFFEDTAREFQIKQLYKSDYAIDNLHPGPTTALNVAKQIAKDLSI